jgi:hypothetical protein
VFQKPLPRRNPSEVTARIQASAPLCRPPRRTVSATSDGNDPPQYPPQV